MTANCHWTDSKDLETVFPFLVEAGQTMHSFVKIVESPAFASMLTITWPQRQSARSQTNLLCAVIPIMFKFRVCEDQVGVTSLGDGGAH